MKCIQILHCITFMKLKAQHVQWTPTAQHKSFPHLHKSQCAKRGRFTGAKKDDGQLDNHFSDPSRGAQILQMPTWLHEYPAGLWCTDRYTAMVNIDAAFETLFTFAMPPGETEPSQARSLALSCTIHQCSLQYSARKKCTKFAWSEKRVQECLSFADFVSPGSSRVSTCPWPADKQPLWSFLPNYPNLNELQDWSGFFGTSRHWKCLQVEHLSPKSKWMTSRHMCTETSKWSMR